MFKKSTLLTTARADKLTEKLNERIGEFDILALIRYLKYYGYEETNMRFTSHQSMMSQTKLVEQVKLYEKHVVITVNLGLLGIQTPLPSSMIKEVVERKLDVDSETDRLLKLLDHVLILNFVASIYPEVNINFFSQWQKTRRNILIIQNVHSIAFLYWLFQRVFPEFVIRFDEKFVPRKVSTESVILDQGGLNGVARLGGVALMSDLCVHINLCLELAHYRTQTIWVSEVEQRLKNFVYPLLNKQETYVFISLELEHESNVRLSNDSRLGRDLLPSNTLGIELPGLQYFILHQGGVDMPEPEPEYKIEWGGACRIRI
jgi:hypothetical protein